MKIISIGVFFVAFIASLNATSQINNLQQITTKNINKNVNSNIPTSKTTQNSDSSISVIPLPKDSIIPDRGIEIDLEKLSRLATLNAKGTVRNAPSNGLVVLNVGIDSTGFPYSLSTVEVSDDVFGTVAVESVRQYAKRYKIKPAIKDGKPIESTNNLIPIVFDMTIFDKK